MQDIFEDAPDGYTDFVELIEHNRGEGDLHAANETREEFSKKFPLLPKIWIDWINDEIEAKSNNDTIETLFERAFKDFQSNDLCMKYMEWSTNFDINLAKLKLERVAQIIGIRPDCASLVWETYLDIEEGMLSLIDEMESEEAKQQKMKISALYSRALRIPHKNHAELWHRYVEFMDGNDIPTKIRAEYEAAAKSYAELVQFENKVSILDDKEALRSVFQEYINFETEKGDPTRIQMIFERALTEFPFDPSLWEDYCRWLDYNLKIHSVILGVYNRACKMCYDYIPLLQRALLSLERAKFAYEDILEVWNQAKASISTVEDGLCIYRTFIYLTQRHLIKEGSSDFAIVNSLFKEACLKLAEDFGSDWDSTAQFKKDYAYFLFVKMKNSNEGRKIWKDIINYVGGNKASIWLEGITIERHFGNISEARKMFYRAVNSVTDEPFKVFENFIQFEREEGTIEELDKALEKVNTQAERIRARESEKKAKQEHKKKGDGDRKRKQLNDSNQVPTKLTKVEPRPTEKVKPVAKLAETMSHVKMETESLQKIDADGFAVPMGLPPAKRRTSHDESIEVGPSEIESNQLKGKVDPNSADAERTVFISNFKFNVEREKFYEIFDNIKDIRLISSGKNRYGYIEFTDESSAKLALKKDRVLIDARPLFVSPYKPHNRGEKSEFKYGTGLERSKIFVKNVHYNATSDDLKNIFSQFGNVKDVRIVMHKNGQPKGVAYVEYETENEANVALLSNQELKIKGRTLQIFLSNPPEKSAQPKLRDVADDQPTQRVARSSKISFVPRSIATKSNANGTEKSSTNKTASSSASTSKGLSNNDFKKFFDK